MLKLNAILISICFIVFEDCACDEECESVAVNIQLFLVDNNGSNLLANDSFFIQDSALYYDIRNEKVPVFFDRDTVNNFLSFFIGNYDTIYVDISGFEQDKLMLTDSKIRDGEGCCSRRIVSYTLKSLNETLCEECINPQQVFLTLRE